MLPTIRIGETDITRLIVGGNPFSGNSHVDEKLDWSMRDYFTTQRIKDTLFRCQENGINAMLLRGDMHIMRIIHEFRQDGGVRERFCVQQIDAAGMQVRFQQVHGVFIGPLVVDVVIIVGV